MGVLFPPSAAYPRHLPTNGLSSTASWPGAAGANRSTPPRTRIDALRNVMPSLPALERRRQSELGKRPDPVSFETITERPRHENSQCAEPEGRSATEPPRGT